MSDKNPPKRQIEKPWVVYYFTFPLIVKIVQDTKEGLDVMDSENVEYLPLIYLGHKNLVRFDTPSKAIEYSCKTYGFSKEKIIKEFLEFPSEKKSLQRLVAQSRSKCIKRKSKKSKQLEKLERVEDFGFPDDLDYA